MLSTGKNHDLLLQTENENTGFLYVDNIKFYIAQKSIDNVEKVLFSTFCTNHMA